MLLPSVRPGVEFKTRSGVGVNHWVLEDSYRMEQVWTNIMNNAINFAKSGSITLIIDWDGSDARFECEDTVPGIPLTEQKKLFERFV